MDDFTTWSHERIAGALEKCTGEQWLRVAKIIRDNEVHGQDLKQHLDDKNPGLLVAFFADELEEHISKFIARQFSKKLREAAATQQQEEVKNLQIVPHANGNVAVVAGVPPPVASCVLNVEFTAGAGVSVSRHGVRSRSLMVAIPKEASVALVKRRLLDELCLPLFSTLMILKAGREIVDPGPEEANVAAAAAAAAAPHVEWATFSFIYAVLLPETIQLGQDNLTTHACVAQHVVLYEEGKRTAPSVGSSSSGLALTIDARNKPLGNGAAGVTYLGAVADATNPQESVPVAVKRFFILESPRFYGMTTSDEVAAWAKLELYPEINTLLALSHPRLVRLRCVGLREVYGTPFPAYIAMDYCNAGTMEQWIAEQRLTALNLVPFLQHFIDAMTYLHVDMKIVHRDIKPDNIFLHRPSPDAAPVLVVGDVRELSAVRLAHETCFCVCIDWWDFV